MTDDRLRLLDQALARRVPQSTTWPRFQRALGWVKWGMALTLGATFAVLLWALGTEEMLKILREL